jgi:hypothetical protein
MDAPPPQENCKPFVDIAFAGEIRNKCAENLCRRPRTRFLLLNDLGNKTYLDVIDGENADALFSDALQALLAFQQLPMVAPLPSYDVALLRRELELFPEWYVKRELGIEFDATAAAGSRQRTADRQRTGPAESAGAPRLHAAQPDAQRAESRRAGLSGCGLRPGHLRRHLPVQGRLPQLA